MIFNRRYGRRAAVVFSAAIAISGLAVSGAAYAASSGPAATQATASSTYNICLKNAKQATCVQANGAGNQVSVTVNSADWANFHYTTSGSSRLIEDGNGNCLRAGDSDIVKIENGPCVSSDGADLWTFSANNLYNALYGNFMLTHGQGSGDNVFHMTFQSGDWTQWTFSTT